MKKFLITILIVVVVALGSAAIWLSTLESSYDVNRSIVINASNTDIFALVQDFNTWELWSPWLCMEPEAQVDISGNGKSTKDTYTWSGELVGQGSITHIKINPQQSIEQEIVFKTPMESRSMVYWEFNSMNDSTSKLTWGMTGEMPFYLRFMTRMMDTWIGMDFERGLKMIKELAEKGFVSSKIEIIDIVDAPAIQYMGQKVTCTMDEMEASMKSSFSDLNSYVQNNAIAHKQALSIYHDFDFIKGKVAYSAAITIHEENLVVKEPFSLGQLPSTKALKIRFQGDYQHLGNAWATAMTYCRTHKINENKDIPSYEIYLNNPQEEPDPRNWITEIYMPIKQ